MQCDRAGDNHLAGGVTQAGKYSDSENRRSYFEEFCSKRVAGATPSSAMTGIIEASGNDWFGHLQKQYERGSLVQRGELLRGAQNRHGQFLSIASFSENRK